MSDGDQEHPILSSLLLILAESRDQDDDTLISPELCSPNISDSESSSSSEAAFESASELEGWRESTVFNCVSFNFKFANYFYTYAHITKNILIYFKTVRSHSK